MTVTHEQYAAWQRRCNDLMQAASKYNQDWVSAVVNLTAQIERDCPDTSVKGHARAARRLATTFKEAKRDAKITEAYEGFLLAWHRLSGAIGVHLIDRP